MDLVQKVEEIHFSGISDTEPIQEAAGIKTPAPSQYHDLLGCILDQIKVVDFREKAGLEDKEKIEKRHYLIVCIEEVLKVAQENKFGLCKRNNFLLAFNGAFWEALEKDDLEVFLGKAAEKMGVDKNLARLYKFREELFKQFLSSAKLPKSKEDSSLIKINLLNGTFEINGENQQLRTVDRRDFLTYQLPFEFDPQAKAPIFDRYLDKVLPDIELQMVLAEYIGYLFVKNQKLKLEKVLMLFGSGANGKSVMFEIVNALLGKENVSNFTLQNLTNENGYYRAKIANKLVNYASEINNRLSADVFKQLASGEPVEARLPYGEPFAITDYAKLIFNCNELPKEIEHTNAFFRRFLIVPFNVTIPEAEQDKELSKKIIESELSGVFNWVLDGLNRLLSQKGFSKSSAIEQQIEAYKTESDSVKMFLDDEQYVSSTINKKYLKELYSEYVEYCKSNGFRPCSAKSLSKRLTNAGFEMIRQKLGWQVFVEKKDFDEPTLSTSSTPMLFSDGVGSVVNAA